MRRIVYAIGIGVALFAALIPAVAPALAQQTAVAPLNCERMLPSESPTRDQLNDYRLCQEIANLREENAQLRRTNETLSTPLAFLLPWSGVITALVVALLTPWVSASINGRIDAREKLRLDQRRQLKREAHNLDLMRGLGRQGDLSAQLTSASALLRRYEDIQILMSDKNTSPSERGTLLTESKLIKDAIFAVLSHTEGADDFCKYVADRMITSFGYVLHTEKGAVTARRAPDLDTTQAPMSDASLQRAQLSKVYWRYVNASKVDFFEANLSDAGLRDGWFAGAAFYGANLRGAVLRNADLRWAYFDKADLRGADLRGADLTGAIGLEGAKFDIATKHDGAIWPDDRRPGQGYPYATEPPQLASVT